MKLPGKEKATFQIITNMLLWLAAGLTTLLLFATKTNSPTAKFPVAEITSFIDGRQFITLFVAGFIVFGMFSLMRHKSIKEEDDKRAKYFAELALDEWASAIINFGSLLFTCIALGATPLYLVAAFCCYLLGYYLKPNE